MVLRCVEKCQILVWRFFQAWNQAHLTKNRPRKAILGLHISTDYKGKQQNSHFFYFVVQASFMNDKICVVYIKKIILTLFGRS